MHSHAERGNDQMLRVETIMLNMAQISLSNHYR
ncbi:hypothetical protein HNR03_000635 [Pseudomonas sp. JAI111]|nr:hypothetical protein [Pseudomonas sp. JAI111]